MIRAICWPLILVASCVVGVARAADQPNIVLILADDLGVNDLACYGRQDHVSPRLDQMAREGLRFTCAYCAQPICSPSRAALMTGLHPAELHITTFLPGRANAPSQKLLHPKIRQQLPLEETTIAERLKEAGYVTGCFGKWHLGGQGFGPKEQGFDVYFAGMANTKPSETEGGKGEYELTRQAMAFMEENKDRPFFCYIPHNTPHIPLAAKPELVEKHKDAFNPTYAAMIESLDECVGMILDKIAALGLDEKTLVIFTSDNGGLHVLESPNTPATHNTPYRAGKGFVYEGGLREPLIVRWPKTVRPAVVAEPVSLLDLPVTFAALAGAKPIANSLGLDQSPLLTGKSKSVAQPAERPFAWHFPHYTNQGSQPSGAYRVGQYKLIEYYDSDRVELFDLNKDLGEQNNLATSDAPRVKLLKSALQSFRDARMVQVNTPNPNFNPALAKPLYEEVDVSNLPAARTAAEMAEKLKSWRAGMNRVLQPSTAPKKP